MRNLPAALRAWGSFEIIGQIPGGNRNISVKVTSRAGVFVAKTTRRSEAALVWLAPVFDCAQTAGFRIPRLIPSKNGKLVETGWTLELFLTGSPAKPADLSRLTPIIKHFHSLTSGFKQRPGFASAHNLITETTGADIDLNLMPERLVNKCRAAWAELPQSTMSVIHADLCAGNVLIEKDQPAALIDWDESRLDCQLFDFPDGKYAAALTAWEIAVCWQVEPERAKFLAARI